MEPVKGIILAVVAIVLAFLVPVIILAWARLLVVCIRFFESLEARMMIRTGRWMERRLKERIAHLEWLVWTYERAGWEDEAEKSRRRLQQWQTVQARLE